jgi:putative transposase
MLGEDHSLARKKQEVSELREQVRELLEPSNEREHQSAARLREPGTSTERPPGGPALNRLLPGEELAIVSLIEKWAPVDRTHRKLAYRGSHTGSAFVSPATVQRIARKHGITVPGEPPRPPRRRLEVPDVPWERNRIWMWEASQFPTAGRVAYALVDVVTRYWLGYLLSIEQSPAQLRLLYAAALEDQGLHGDGGDGGPILVGWSDDRAGSMPAGTPTQPAHVESLFGHLRIEWPQLNLPTDPDSLDQELARLRDEYNTVRLHAAIGYVTPSDEHEGRGPQIHEDREDGLRRARVERIRHNRALED